MELVKNKEVKDMKKLNLENPNKKKGFTCLVKHFRSNPLTAMLRSRLSRFSQTKFRCAHTSHTLRMQAHSKSKDFGSLCNSYGFTLAETLITLTILGIVAAITVPGLINRQQEAANKTKVKKAMTMYEKALNQMIIENDLKTNQAIIDFGAEGGACANTTEYFKKVEGDGCRFKTADRIWWDISDIENPLIILNDKKKDETVENLQALAKDTNDITTYAFVGKIDDSNSTIRINDNAFEQTNGTDDQKAYMSKLYNFINNVKSGGEVAVDPYAQYAKTCSDECSINWSNKESSTNCYGCTFGGTDPYEISHGYREMVFDENGKLVKSSYTWNPTNPTKIETIYYEENQTIIERLARLQDPNLPEEGVRYTRKVTQLWCGVFMLNIAISTLLIIAEQFAWWAIYTGVIAYVIMGVVMGGEWLFRKMVIQR